MPGELCNDFDTGAGPDARSSSMKHCVCVGKRTYAARCLDSCAMSGDAAEQGDVVCGGSAGGEARAGLQEVCACGECKLRCAEFFFEGEKTGLEDDFDYGSFGVGDLD